MKTENEKPKYCLADYSERFANLIKEHAQASHCLKIALKINESALDEIMWL